MLVSSYFKNLKTIADWLRANMIEWYINNREIQREKNEAQVDIPLLQRGRRRVAKKDSNLGFRVYHILYIYIKD